MKRLTGYKIKFKALLLICLGSGIVNAQITDTLKRNKLLEVLKNYDVHKMELRLPYVTPTDTQKANLLWDISFCDDYANNRTSIAERASTLRNLSEKLNYKKGIVKALLLEGILTSQDSGRAKAIYFYKKALDISNEIKYKWGIGTACYYMGMSQAENNDDIPWLYKAIKIGDETNDSLLLNLSYATLAGLYSTMGNNKDAVACNERCILYWPDSLKNCEKYAIDLSYLGYFYTRNGQYDKADSTFAATDAIIAKNNFVGILVIHLNAVSELSALRGNMGKAIQVLLRANHLVDSLKADIGYKVYNNLTIAEYILKSDNKQLAIAGISVSKKYDEVIAFANRAVQDAIPINFKDAMIESYKYMSQAYEAKGDMNQALKYIKLSDQIKYSLYNTENTKTIQGLKMQYETEKKEQQIALLNKDKEIKQTEIDKQATQRNAIAGSLILLAVISGVAYNRFRLKQHANRKLSLAFERLRTAQQQLIEQEKLAAMGQLTAGIAHEIQNPLNFVINFSALAEDIFTDIEEAKSEEEKTAFIKELQANVDKIDHHTVRAENIINNMMQHANDEKGTIQDVDVNRVCKDAVMIAQQAANIKYPKFNCSIMFDSTSRDCYIKGLSQELMSVILNLLNNACYAVNEKSKQNEDYQKEVNIKLLEQNQTLRIIVTDNGTGISEETKSKIFQPFFTTKHTSEGTGLGLSLSHDIIKNHGGDIQVESKLGEGTAFTIQLPIS